jgi:hypothetical protein
MMEFRSIEMHELFSLPPKEKYIDVAEVCDSGANQLCVVVEEMSLKRLESTVALGPVSKITPIVHQAGDMVFKISWERYVIFQVLNESFDSGNRPAEVWEGHLFRKYSESRYLSYV